MLDRVRRNRNEIDWIEIVPNKVLVGNTSVDFGIEIVVGPASLERMISAISKDSVFLK
ncbi:hypothetical protein LEP1GSC060_1691 [Leptospira weilii serovar Ranarum str. ICFT]|uniref:Uncharacterized protein n=1 Tax=Leptospira weilii serovar Ranarum str. ICFT TaxID=1218598 RepID=N1WQE1_9LEPT|nr:hypothetical protein LEP1GSC060_1691 [Leptospira weilii serovar Ranarum str. ICFT]